MHLLLYCQSEAVPLRPDMTKELPHEEAINLEEEKISSPPYLDSNAWNRVTRGRCTRDLRRTYRFNLHFPGRRQRCPLVPALLTLLLRRRGPDVPVRYNLKHPLPKAVVAGVYIISRRRMIVANNVSNTSLSIRGDFSDLQGMRSSKSK